MYMAVYLSPLTNTERDRQMPKPTLKDRDEPVSPAHFVPLADIMQSYEGAVHTYMCQSDAPNVVVTLLISVEICLLYTSPSPRDGLLSRMPSSA